ncbi:protoheme IX farnesyltransferase-like [Nilaparvata lugens]|uniref:protoheme IX farnesyltransferase-like n=1 Tax=Nilaparvata lugens TaxID=108931 RepID=UPI00193D09E5|nr:protoheme IX farnesyltransferase-like [Nilaparvata lugens]
MEIYEFHHLIAEGFGPDRSAFLSSFFALVGTHGLHVTSGLIWIIVMMIQGASTIPCFSPPWWCLVVVASGCVFNNYIDRDIDKKMERTKNRVLVKGLIAPSVTLVYATVLGIAGFALLYIAANPLAMWLAVMGFVVYVGVYSLYMKRHSVYGTLIGSLSGAAPPVIGYCAVTNEFDAGALILLAIFSLWQMPHLMRSLSSALRLPGGQHSGPAGGERHFVAKNHITVYILAFMIATLMLTLVGYAGYKYLIVAAAVSVWWLGMALRGYKTENDSVWARKLFVFSIVAITSLSVMMSIDFSATAAPEALVTYVW